MLLSIRIAAGADEIRLGFADVPAKKELGGTGLKSPFKKDHVIPRMFNE